jgi:hypothetical protein
VANESVKPWQIAILVIGGLCVVGAGAYSFLFSGDTIKLSSSMTMVDVSTGELFEFDVSGGKAVFPPELNPNTGKRALLPVGKSEDGKWRIGTRYLEGLSGVEVKPDALVDLKSGEVKVKSESASRGR